MQPSFHEFVNADVASITPLAPETLVFAASGTRRSAVLAGYDADSDDYARWAREQMMDACEMIFRHGVRNIFTILATPGQFKESGPYRERLIDWIRWGVSGPEAEQDYARMGCRARLISDGFDESFDAVDAELQSTGHGGRDHVLWHLVVQDRDALWQRILQAIVETRAVTRSDAIGAAYGEQIAPASLYLGFGKPTVAPELLPPLIADMVNCYWSQTPGYRLDVPKFRSILYDHLYLRKTWTEEKGRRAQQIDDLDHDWDSAPILGLGEHRGPFWYPIWSNSLETPSDTDTIP